MSDEEIALVLKDVGIARKITCPQAPGVAKKARVSFVDPGDHCTSNGIEIRGCRPGCFR
jgi:hypothetical protein